MDKAILIHTLRRRVNIQRRDIFFGEVFFLDVEIMAEYNPKGNDKRRLKKVRFPIVSVKERINIAE